MCNENRYLTFTFDFMQESEELNKENGKRKFWLPLEVGPENQLKNPNVAGKKQQAGFYKQAVVELWEVETAKWAVVNLNLGSCKIDILKRNFIIFMDHLLVRTGYFSIFHETLTE